VSDDLRAAIMAAADAVDAARAELGRLDGAAGDGDHGMTMSIGARNVRRRFEKAPPDATPGDLVRLVAQAMGDVGGAIGPLHSAALTAIAAQVDAPVGGAGLDVARLRRAAEAAEAAIVGLGHAVPGDKTVIDALHPLVESLRGSEAASTAVGPALQAAAAAAEAGAATTTDMVARLGRASRLGERSRGLPDAGATSLAIVVRALADAHAQTRSGNG
jgi:phosphoenolpyruvate---glycerone phosphotransferase subunit DhaL